jgi:MFS family permease
MSAFLLLYWIRVLGGSEATGGQLVSLLFGSGVLGGLAGGWLADRLGHRKIDAPFLGQAVALRAPPRQLAVSFGVPELGSDHWA